MSNPAFMHEGYIPIRVFINKAENEAGEVIPEIDHIEGLHQAAIKKAVHQVEEEAKDAFEKELAKELAKDGRGE